jgi:anti-sigma B factor antagonist
MPRPGGGFDARCPTTYPDGPLLSAPTAESGDFTCPDPREGAGDESGEGGGNGERLAGQGPDVGDWETVRSTRGTGDQENEARVVERELKVTVEVAPETAAWPVVKVSGEVDIQSSPVLEERLAWVLDQGHSSVVVDLGEVTFLDSTGLSVLISGLRHCQTAGGELRLVSLRPNVRKVLEITGLTDAFQVGAVDDAGEGDRPGESIGPG